MAQLHGRQLLADVLHRHAELPGHLLIPALHVLIRDADVLQPGDLRHGQLIPGGLQGVLPGVGPEVLLGHAGHLQIVGQGGSLAHQAVFQLLQKPGELALHHGVGHLYLHAVQHLAHQGVGVGIPGLGLLALEGGGHDGLAQGRRIRKALGPGKFVVQLRHTAADDAVGLHPEHRRLPRQLRGVLLGEGHMDLPLLLRADPRHLLLEAVDEHAAAQQQGIVLGLAAVEGHAVHGAVEVQGHLVAHGGPVPLLLHQVGLEPLAFGLVHIVVGQLRLGHGGGQALVLAQLYLRIQLRQGGEGEALRPDVHDAQLRRPGHQDLLLAEGLHQGPGEGLVHRLLIEHVRGVGLLQGLAGGLAGGAAVHGVQVPVGLIGVVQGLLPLLPLHPDGQLHPVVFLHLFVQYGHGCSSKFMILSPIIPEKPRRRNRFQL